MIKSKINDCPFCGNDKKQTGDNFGVDYVYIVRTQAAMPDVYKFYVLCLECNASGPLCKSSVTAANMWNDVEKKS